MDLSGSEYNEIKAKFPDLPELEESFQSRFIRENHPELANSAPSYGRDEMLRALWTVAGHEESEAKSLIENLKQQ